MAKAPKTPRRDRHKDGVTVEKLPSGNWRARVWDSVQRRYRDAVKPTKDEAERAGLDMAARFRLGQDSAERVTLERVWDSFSRERYGIAGEEADAIGSARRAREEAAKHGARLRVSWSTVHSMARVVALMRAAGAEDFKANSFRARIVGLFNGLELSRSKARDGRVAVSTKERMRSQVRALVNHAINAGWLITSPIAGMRVTGSRQQADTTREVFSLSEVRALVGLHRPSDPVWVHAMLMLYAGLRDSEARAVSWLDYEPERRLLWVRKAKGGKARAVPVQPELADLLSEVSGLIGPTAVIPCIPSTPIARPTPGRSIPRYENWTKTLDDAGVPRTRGIDPLTNMDRTLCRHSCRHTYAAAMLSAGEDGDSLRISMGHGSADLTALYASQASTFRAEVEVEEWRRGVLKFRRSIAGNTQEAAS